MERFYPVRLLNVRTKDCASVLAATLLAIRMRKDAARVVIFRYGLRRKQGIQVLGGLAGVCVFAAGKPALSR